MQQTTQVLPQSTTDSKLVQIAPLDSRLQRLVAQERARLQKELGLDLPKPEHYRRPVERPFTKKERPHATILFGGLTWKHEKLIQGALESLGYKAEPLPTPDLRSYQIGKEYGNNGQCNPTYFTVGNLVKYLQELEQRGLSRQEILERYVFFTAGACGPCRFGMYESEYRLALRNAGFDGFRVLLFQQTCGLNQSDVEAGLEMNVDFFLGILNALNCGDVLNQVSYAIRPFEILPGETDRALEESVEMVYQVFRSRKTWRAGKRLRKFLGDWTEPAEFAGKFVQQLVSRDLVEALEACRERFDRVEVDRLRLRPVVKITGEFWAQTTEGDGNFNMFRFLEGEGAQVLVEPVGTWITYVIHQVVQKCRDTKGLEESALLPPWWQPARWRVEWRYWQKLAKLKLAEAIFRREYHRLARVFGGLVHALADQYELQRLGHPYYNSRAGGGEGHLEVAKNIYYSTRGLAHMVLSLKPFGCMPSTQSDGVQAAVTAHFKDMIYLPIETSGEGEINAHSRVQMALGEARAKARRELEQALQATGLTLDLCRSYVDAHPEMKRPFYPLPHRDGVAGVAANMVWHISERMRQQGWRSRQFAVAAGVR